MTKTQELEVVAWDKLRELIGQYFDLGYAEGVVQRDTDTMAGDAQRTLSEIEGIISSASATIKGVEADKQRISMEWAETLNALEAAEAERDALRQALERIAWHDQTADQCAAIARQTLSGSTP